MAEQGRLLKDFLNRAAGIVSATIAAYGFRTQIRSFISSSIAESAGVFWAHNSRKIFVSIIIGWLITEAVFILYEVLNTRLEKKSPLMYLEPEGESEESCRRLVDFASESLGPSAATASLSADKLRLVIHKNPSYVWILSGVKKRFFKKDKEIKAYFLAAGLTPEATAMIVKGELPNGHYIEAEHIADDFDEASAIYIFGVYSVRKSNMIASCAVSSLASEIVRLVETYKMDFIFARPGTLAGGTQMKRFMFREIEKSEIQFVRRSQIINMWPRYKGLIDRYAIKV